jgi:hypothetical protein
VEDLVSNRPAPEYDDGSIACTATAMIIRRYYFPWGGAKTVPYTAIRAVEVLPLTGRNWIRWWRLSGTGDFRHWWNWDSHRLRKKTALVLHVGGFVRPSITPDDPATVHRLIAQHTHV